MRTYQKNNIRDEVSSYIDKCNSHSNIIEQFTQEKCELEKENSLYQNSVHKLQNEKNNLLQYQDELSTKTQLLEKEIQLLKERQNNNEKLKFDNDVYNSTSLKHVEHINKEISDNNKKINFLQIKTNDLVSDIKKTEELLSIENYEFNNLYEFNQTLERKVMTLKESVKMNENKIISIKKEIDNVMEYIQEGTTDRNELNYKLEELINVFSHINKNNKKLTTILNLMVGSMSKRSLYLAKESEKMEEMLNLKNKILNLNKDVCAYKTLILEN